MISDPLSGVMVKANIEGHGANHIPLEFWVFGFVRRQHLINRLYRELLNENHAKIHKTVLFVSF